MIKVIVHFAKVAIAVIAALLAVSCNISGFKKVDGSGNVVTKTRPAAETFTHISAGGGIEVVIEQGASKSITIEADDNLHEHIKTEIKNGSLEISTDANFRSAKTAKVTVQLPEIEGIEASAGVQVTSKNTLKADAIDLISSSGSGLTVAVTAKTVSCDTSSGSSIKVEGTADKLESDSSSGSTMDAEKLSAKTVIVGASSGSTSIVNPSESLSADASSGGNIQFVKTPNKLDKKTSSGGSVTQQ